MPKYKVVQQGQRQDKSDVSFYVSFDIEGELAQVQVILSQMAGSVQLYEQSGSEEGSEIAIPTNLKPVKITPYLRFDGNSKLQRAFNLKHTKSDIKWLSSTGPIKTLVKDKFYANPLFSNLKCENARLEF